MPRGRDRQAGAEQGVETRCPPGREEAASVGLKPHDLSEELGRKLRRGLLPAVAGLRRGDEPRDQPVRLLLPVQSIERPGAAIPPEEVPEELRPLPHLRGGKGHQHVALLLQPSLGLLHCASRCGAGREGTVALEEADPQRLLGGELGLVEGRRWHVRVPVRRMPERVPGIQEHPTNQDQVVRGARHGPGAGEDSDLPWRLLQREALGGDPAIRGLEPKDPAVGARDPDRAADVRAEPQGRPPRCDQRPLAAARRAWGAREVPGVQGPAVDVVLRLPATHEERGDVAAHERDRAGLPENLHEEPVLGQGSALARHDPDGAVEALLVEAVFQRDRQPLERPPVHRPSAGGLAPDIGGLGRRQRLLEALFRRGVQLLPLRPCAADVDAGDLRRGEFALLHLLEQRCGVEREDARRLRGSHRLQIRRERLGKARGACDRGRGVGLRHAGFRDLCAIQSRAAAQSNAPVCLELEP
mmetsp:Transcript_79625/g.245636  ORF Transcript_79625/g.245636 Transcript_79625/m.245636 type:complete len:471 (-) Transcript_79625:17-1429(-)